MSVYFFEFQVVINMCRVVTCCSKDILNKLRFCSGFMKFYAFKNAAFANNIQQETIIINNNPMRILYYAFTDRSYLETEIYNMQVYI